MKTTHQIAKELLALPDVPLVIEGWVGMSSYGHETIAVMTEYDPTGTAILVQRPTAEAAAKWMREARPKVPGEEGEPRWLNIGQDTEYLED